MKKRNKFLAVFLAAVCMMATTVTAFADAAPDGSSNAANMPWSSAFADWKANVWDKGLKDDWTQVSMTPGKDETSVNFAWYSVTGETTSLTYGTKEDLSDGQTVEIEATATEQEDADGNLYTSNKATISGLQPGTTYYYQVAGKDVESFTTGEADSFRFAFIGDPQIGSSNELKGEGVNGEELEAFYQAQSEAVASDSYNWGQTMKLAQEAGSDFVVSAGDQIQTTLKKSPTATTSEIEYAGYLSPEALTSLPVATTVGNHDADNPNYQYHFNVPNLSYLGDNDVVGGDYYFTYGDVLFMMLNTQDTNSAEHIEFIENTVAKNQDCKWRIVTLHQDIYGSAEHSNEPEIVNLRYALTPAFEANGVDVVLTGHDHAYSRSKFLNGDQAEEKTTYTDDEFDEMLDVDVDYSGEGTLTTAPGNIKDDTTDEAEKTYLNYLKEIMDDDRITTDNAEYAVNPSGILYLTASSSSGSKYYDLVARQQNYIAGRWQKDVPTYSLINVTENTLTINTYRTDNNEAIDKTVTIVKTADTEDLDAMLEDIESNLADGTLDAAKYTSDSWSAFQTALDAAEAAKGDVNSTQETINNVYAALTAAYNELVPVADNEALAQKVADLNTRMENGTLKEADYTAASWKNLTKAMETADTVLANRDASEQEINDALNALIQAEASLEKAASDNGSGAADDQNNGQNTQDPSSNKTSSASKVKTGDETQAVMWTWICVAGMGAVAVSVLGYKKAERKREK